MYARCPPQSALTIIVEVQTTNSQAQNEFFHTSAWIKIPLFDHKNRLLNGRWKLPLNKLPIRHDEDLAVISTLPTVCNIISFDKGKIMK